MYDDVKVSLSLGDLSAIHCAANCLKPADEKCEALEKRNAELLKECERQAKDITELRLSISDAKDELDAWKKAENVEKPIVDALAYLDEHNTPFEDKSVDKACEVIRALLSRTQKPAKPCPTPFNDDAEDLL